MVDQMRTCRRTACRWPAMASLSFRYETRQVWLTDLMSPPHPAVWDLCPHHADTLTVPRGWTHLDERRAAPAPVEPAGRDLVPAPAGSQPVPATVGKGLESSTTHADVSRADRYAALRASLPRIAAELADDDELVDRHPRPSSGPTRPTDSVANPPLPPLVELSGQLRLPLEGGRNGVVVSIEQASTRRRSDGPRLRPPDAVRQGD